ncbi:hypothetical protein [Maridesulfovibrio hydrothermalis]|uniref:Uncharacterized protein n=1 Tax=Maridesulfovibrio hydrothermalis AM13 = DSM 14728 TaxID=1121451 RepID=L0R907_9BACT|nr:hypothetical protein [Maridesulfovibrio hydrothermalis]CCO22707.1 protein of unknown function [Maridesulfovibrio hydrothermalis AM13 = DSM 14728]
MNRELAKQLLGVTRENGDLCVELSEIKARSEYSNEASRKAS